jgi:hypothetical protein
MPQKTTSVDDPLDPKFGEKNYRDMLKKDEKPSGI